MGRHRNRLAFPRSPDSSQTALTSDVLQVAIVQDSLRGMLDGVGYREWDGQTLALISSEDLFRILTGVYLDGTSLRQMNRPLMGVPEAAGSHGVLRESSLV